MNNTRMMMPAEEYRVLYGRPHYTWDRQSISKGEKRILLQQYNDYREKLKHGLYIGSKEGTYSIKEIREFRLYTLDQLIIDLETQID